MSKNNGSNGCSIGILDLDALERPPIKIKLGGVEYAMVPLTVETVRDFKRLADSDEIKGDGIESDIRGLKFLVPSLGEAQILKLQPAQVAAIVAHWTTSASASVAADVADTERVIAHPSLPG